MSDYSCNHVYFNYLLTELWPVYYKYECDTFLCELAELGATSGIGRGLTSRSTFDLENGRNGPRQDVHNNMRNDVTSSGSDIDGSSSLSGSMFTLDTYRE